MSFSTPYMLSAADCESWTPGEVFAMEEGSLDAFLSMQLMYTESQGDPALRDEIASVTGGVGPEHCVVFAGAEEAIFITMHALLSAETMQSCSFLPTQSLHEVARHVGAEVSFWQFA